MDLLCELALCWGAIHFYTAVYLFMVGVGPRRRPRSLGLAALALGIGFLSVGTGLVFASHTAFSPLIGYCIEWLGFATATLGACEYAIAHHAGTLGETFAVRARWLRRCVRVWCVIGLGVLVFDWARGGLGYADNSTGLALFSSAPVVVFVSPSSLSRLWLALGVAVAVLASALLVGSPHVSQDSLPERPGSRPPWAITSRLIGVLAAIVTICGTHDLLVQMGLIRSFPLFPLPAAVAVVLGGFSEVQRLSAFRLALGETTRELEAQRGQLEEARELLIRQEALAALGELSAALAHEVRNPLAVLKTAVAGLRNTRLGVSDKKTLLGVLVEESGRLRELSEDLVAFAVAPNAVAVACSPHVIVTAAVQQQLARGDALHVELDVGVERVDCDEALMVRALGNLIRNAAQARRVGEAEPRPEFSFAKAEFTAPARRPGAVAPALPVEVPPRWLLIRVIEQERQGTMFTVFSVADRGAGMPADATIRAFEPFFSTKPRGTGLGLPIVRRIARAHGGDAEIAETGPTGTTVRFWIRNAQSRQR